MHISLVRVAVGPDPILGTLSTRQENSPPDGISVSCRARQGRAGQGKAEQGNTHTLIYT